MNIQDRFSKISTFIFDMDGVLTDGTVLLLDSGVQARRMSIRDGYALQLAVKKGYRVVVISGGTSDAVKERLDKLGVKDCFLKVDDKKGKLSEYVAEHGLKWEEILFMGDDIPDHASMQLTGLPCCPADAASEIKQCSHYISPIAGGKGCARDVIEKVLKLNGHWNLDTSVTSR